MRHLYILTSCAALLVSRPAAAQNLLRTTDPAFFQTEQARHIGEQVLLYQRCTGGWPKNIDMATPLDSAQRAQVQADKRRRNDSTIDNNATTTQIRFLAQLYQATGEERFKQGVQSGVEYLLGGQYPNGGWPQFWPENRDYQVHITYNDNAMVGTMEVLLDMQAHTPPYDSDILDRGTLARIDSAVARGIDCILATQIVVNGQPTVWCQQHDRMTLEPAAARAYELPSFCSSESVGIVRLLMSLPHADARIKRAVDGAMAWFDRHKITGYRYERVDGNATLVPDPAAQPIWARFYDLEECRPFVCDRDGIPRRRLDEIGTERRNGYSWYGPYAAQLFPLYRAWCKKHE